MATNPIPLYTADQYLAMEETAEFRSEYIDGQIVAMAGASINHSRIVSALQNAIFNQLGEADCTVLTNDLRVQCANQRMYTYPDIVVFCGQEKLAEKRSDTVVDATLIAEVLSPSTRNWDIGSKFEYYRTLPSLQQYLMLEQDSIRAMLYTRQPDGSWLLREFGGVEALVDLSSINCSFPLGIAYRRVTFESRAE